MVSHAMKFPAVPPALRGTRSEMDAGLVGVYAVPQVRDDVRVIAVVERDRAPGRVKPQARIAGQCPFATGQEGERAGALAVADGTGRQVTCLDGAGDGKAFVH